MEVTARGAGVGAKPRSIISGVKFARLVCASAGALLVGCSGGGNGAELPKPKGANEVTFRAGDGLEVFGDRYSAKLEQASTLMLLFHQAGSSADEFATIAPKLAAKGYDCLAVDLRSGGDRFGANRTAEAFEGEADYESAYQDMKAAVIWAKKEGYHSIILFGSSYSASLSLRLAAEEQGIAGVIAFSPGEYFTKKGIVRSWAGEVRVPTFLTGAPGELDAVQQIYEAMPIEEKRLCIPGNGVHGASMLIPERNPKGASDVWDELTEFLNSWLRP